MLSLRIKSEQEQAETQISTVLPSDPNVFDLNFTELDVSAAS